MNLTLGKKSMPSNAGTGATTLVLALAAILALGLSACTKTDRMGVGMSGSGPAANLNDPSSATAPAVNTDSGPPNGTVGILNFSNLSRYYSATMNLANYATVLKNPVFPTIVANAQATFPISNLPSALQSPPIMMSIQQVAVAACTDMVAGEVAGMAATPPLAPSFLVGITVSKGPSAVSTTALTNYINAVGMAFTGTTPTADQVQILTQAFNDAVTAAPSVSAIGTNLSSQTMAALELVCAAMGSSAQAITL